MDEPDFVSLGRCRVAVVGLGLMGGSLALALRGANACREIVGVDTDPAALDLARAQAVIDHASDFDSALDCDLLILATPVGAILSQLNHLMRAPRHTQYRERPSGRERPLGREASLWDATRILDLGSTKSQIVAAMENLPARFDPLGGHPMCGKEVSGLAHAEPDLFQGKTFVLTPLMRTSPAALALADELIAAIGARPLVLSPERHDSLAAMTSHLPYLAAVALVQAALSLNDEQLWSLAASGFRDTSRLAASDLTMMIDILLTNRPAILDSLSRYRAGLDALIAAVDSADPDALRAVLAPAQAQRAELFK